MDRLIHPALQGKPVAWFAPNYRLLAEVWRQVNETLDPIITKSSQQEWRIELRGGGVVEMWSQVGSLRHRWSSGGPAEELRQLAPITGV